MMLGAWGGVGGGWPGVGSIMLVAAYGSCSQGDGSQPIAAQTLSNFRKITDSVDGGMLHMALGWKLEETVGVRHHYTRPGT